MWDKLKKQKAEFGAHSSLLQHNDAYIKAYRDNDVRKMQRIKDDYVALKLRDVKPKDCSDFLSSSEKEQFEPTKKIVPSIQSRKYYGHLYGSKEVITFKTLIWCLVHRNMYPRYFEMNDKIWAAYFVDLIEVSLRAHFEKWYFGNEANKRPTEAWYFEECLFLYCRQGDDFSLNEEQPQIKHAIKTANMVSFNEYFCTFRDHPL